MTKLEELKAAYAAALDAWDAYDDAAYDAACAADAARDAAYKAADARDAAYDAARVADAAYRDELEKTQEENTSD